MWLHSLKFEIVFNRFIPFFLLLIVTYLPITLLLYFLTVKIAVSFCLPLTWHLIQKLDGPTVLIVYELIRIKS